MSDSSREEQNKVFNSPLANASKRVGFEIPVDVVPLPSEGKLYPLGHPLHNEKEVEIKCMTAAEEDLLTSSALIKNGTVISRLLESCILNTNLDADSLLVGDRNAILMAIRITGYGKDYPVKIKCPSCDREYEKVFDLSQLKIKNLGGSPQFPNQNLFSFDLPVSKKNVVYKLLTGKDEYELTKNETQRRKVLGSQIDHLVTSRLMTSIVSYSGESSPDKIAQAVKNMPAFDSKALRAQIDKIEPEVDMNQMCCCPFCDDEREVRVPMGPNFFWPDFGK